MELINEMFTSQFVVASLVAPGVLLLFILVIRHAVKSELSSGVDVVVAMMAIDVAAALSPDEFVKIAAARVGESLIRSSAMSLFLFGVITVAVVCVFLEPRLERPPRATITFAGKRPPFAFQQFFWAVSSWAICWIFVFAHVYNLRGGFVSP